MLATRPGRNLCPQWELRPRQRRSDLSKTEQTQATPMQPSEEADPKGLELARRQGDALGEALST